MRKWMQKIPLYLGAFALFMALSCESGPVGGYQISVVINDSTAQFEKARIYVDKIHIFAREDGTIGYHILPADTNEYTHLLINLVGGEKGADPVFSMSWIVQAKSVEEIAGRNIAVFSMKMFPDIVEYRKIAKIQDYIASYNGQTCYIMLTITNVSPEKKWLNGIFNGVYIEKVGNKWRRMELREGRFGANYEMAATVN